MKSSADAFTLVLLLDDDADGDAKSKLEAEEVLKEASEEEGEGELGADTGDGKSVEEGDGMKLVHSFINKFVVC